MDEKQLRAMQPGVQPKDIRFDDLVELDEALAWYAHRQRLALCDYLFWTEEIKTYEKRRIELYLQMRDKPIVPEEIEERKELYRRLAQERNNASVPAEEKTA